MKYLIKILERSVEKNGEVPLTNNYLLNILKLAKKMEVEQNIQSALMEVDIYELYHS